jgi:uncharacterized protein
LCYIGAVYSVGIRLQHTITIWQVVDGKRGHERQTEGLIAGLASLGPVEIQKIRHLSIGQLLALLVSKCLGKRSALHNRSVDLVVGAGHATHLSLLVLAKINRAKSVVLMKPSFPCAWFDLCLIPQHDGVTGTHILNTVGALNPMGFYSLEAEQSNKQQYVMLIGGPSKHFIWDTDSVIKQIKKVVEHDAGIAWVLSTSRRTPVDFIPRLQACQLALQWVDYQAVDAQWLPQALTQSHIVWVTPDSVSMLYEAMTAGCEVGVFNLNAQSNSAIANSVLILQHAQTITNFNDWESTKRMQPANIQFNEALRCAQWIKQQWFPKH